MKISYQSINQLINQTYVSSTKNTIEQMNTD